MPFLDIKIYVVFLFYLYFSCSSLVLVFVYFLGRKFCCAFWFVFFLARYCLRFQRIFWIPEKNVIIHLALFPAFALFLQSIKVVLFECAYVLLREIFFVSCFVVSKNYGTNSNVKVRFMIEVNIFFCLTLVLTIQDCLFFFFYSREAMN